MLSEHTVLAEESKECVCLHMYLLCCSFKFSRHENITRVMKWQLQKQQSLLVPLALRIFLDVFHPTFHRFHWNSGWISEVLPPTSKESVLPPAGRWLGWVLCAGVWEAACLTASWVLTALPLRIQFVEYITKVVWKKMLLGFANWCARAFKWDREVPIYTSKTEPCPWIYLPSSFGSW